MCLAVPGRIVKIQGDEPFRRNGRVDFGGVLREVNLACVPEAREGDYVLVHVGLALSVLDEEEAREVFEALRRIEAAEETESPETQGEVR
ncbi:MAG: HypC/HybG/HupF family hydrogenase formation chaperone [Acidobacteriota bacterium]|jgi:hydrogenase expression/formation protein HypC